jgi:hypothetical protein
MRNVFRFCQAGGHRADALGFAGALLCKPDLFDVALNRRAGPALLFAPTRSGAPLDLL